MRTAKMRRQATLLVTALVLWGCDSSDYPERRPDAGHDADAGHVDATPDATPDAMPDPGPPRAIFELDERTSFFDLPFPFDLRRNGDTIEVRDFPNPSGSPLLQQYLELMSTRVRGFAISAPVYFRFSHTIDEDTLPEDAAASLDEDATVFLIDVDPDSPKRGERHPAILHYRDEPTFFWPAHTLAVRPPYGVSLAPGRTYAAVITRGVHGEAVDLDRDEDFEATLAGDRSQDVRALLEPAIEVIEDAGVSRDDILSMTVFTTQDPRGELEGVRDWIHEEYPEPEIKSIRRLGVVDGYTHLQGTYGPSPLFGTGEPPYYDEGGALSFDEDGAPIVQDDADLRFVLTIPTTPMPEAGYPVVLYAHGTGGDFRSVLDSGAAKLLARHGIASIGFDQIHHGPRNPTDISPENAVFNFLNPEAIRDVFRLSALDLVQLARLVPNVDVSATTLDRETAAKLDPEHVYFYGHSQGGLNGPIYLAIDDSARGAVLSGAGAGFAISVVDKTEPIRLAIAVQIALRLPGSTLDEAIELEHLVYEHPVLGLFTAWAEVSDGISYADRIFANPREGFAPKSVLMTEGLRDDYAPPRTMEALAATARIPVIQPQEHAVEGLVALGIPSVRGPVANNVADGEATAGLIQIADGDHFVAMTNEDLEAAIGEFFASMVRGEPQIDFDR